MALLSAYLPALESSMLENLRNVGIPSTEGHDVILAILPGLAEHVERWLQSELLVFPFVAALRLRGRAGDPEVLDQFLSFLDGERRHPRAMPTSRWTEDVRSFPTVRWMIRQIRAGGSKSQRAKLKRILGRAAARKGGHPRKAIEARADVTAAKLLEGFERRLEAGFKYVETQRQQDRYESDDDVITPALQSQGYKPNETTALLECRTLRMAAATVIAGPRKNKRSVLSTASRGRRLIAQTRSR